MQRNIKLAPNMKKQKSNSLNAFILVGSQAWDFAKMPKLAHMEEVRNEESALL